MSTAGDGRSSTEAKNIETWRESSTLGSITSYCGGIGIGSKSSSRMGGVDVTKDWYWEGNVVEAIASFLTQNGWKVIKKADTRSKERGVDIHAYRDGVPLLVEVKGFPSKSYRDVRRAGETKPTNPVNQAQQWYSHALLKVMRLQTRYPEAVVALGFPDFPRYRALFQETQGGLAKLGVAMLTVGADGTVETWGLAARNPKERQPPN